MLIYCTFIAGTRTHKHTHTHTYLLVTLKSIIKRKNFKHFFYFLFIFRISAKNSTDYEIKTNKKDNNTTGNKSSIQWTNTTSHCIVFTNWRLEHNKMPAEWRKMSDSRSKTKNLVDNNGQWFLSWQIFLVTTSRLSNVFVFLLYPVRGNTAWQVGILV